MALKAVCVAALASCVTCSTSSLGQPNETCSPENSSCYVAHGASILQARVIEKREGTTTTTTEYFVDWGIAINQDLGAENSEVELNVTGVNLTFKNTKGYKKRTSNDVFVGETANGEATLQLVKERNGDMFGNIVDIENGTLYHIAPDAHGRIVVTQQNLSDFKDGDDEVFVGGTDDNEAALVQGDSDQVEDGSRLDVLIVWTHAAECENSKLSAGCTHTAQTDSNMKGLIDLAIEETNAAFDLSGIQTELRLVHSYRDSTGYDDQGDLGANLNALTNPSDGKLDDAHTKREQYGADLVVLMAKKGNYCGIAHLGPRKSHMFSVTAFNCATGYYSFGHEIAHNLGCNHDRGTTRTCGGAGYNYGYRDPEGNFRSIMGYACRTGQCDNNAGGRCVRVQRFSTPDIKYNFQGRDRPIGTADANNAKQINDVRVEVSNYFPPSGPVTPTRRRRAPTRRRRAPTRRRRAPTRRRRAPTRRRRAPTRRRRAPTRRRRAPTRRRRAPTRRRRAPTRRRRAPTRRRRAPTPTRRRSTPSTPSPAGPCADTPGWENGAGHSCEVYSKDTWCRDGFFYGVAALHNNPDQNCCQCGKGDLIVMLNSSLNLSGIGDLKSVAGSSTI